MLSFVGFVSCSLVLSITLVAVQPLTLRRVDSGSNIFCTQVATDKDVHVADLRYHRISVQREAGHVRGFDDENTSSDQDTNVYNVRSKQEWKKIRRYIKRKLKVPRRYLKKIIRTLTTAATTRSTDSGDIFLMSHDAAVLGNNLSESNGRFDKQRLLVLVDKEPVQYFGIISAPGN